MMFRMYLKKFAPSVFFFFFFFMYKKLFWYITINNDIPDTAKNAKFSKLKISFY